MLMCRRDVPNCTEEKSSSAHSCLLCAIWNVPSAHPGAFFSVQFETSFRTCTIRDVDRPSKAEEEKEAGLRKKAAVKQPASIRCVPLCLMYERLSGAKGTSQIAQRTQRCKRDVPNRTEEWPFSAHPLLLCAIWNVTFAPGQFLRRWVSGSQLPAYPACSQAMLGTCASAGVLRRGLYLAV